MKVIIQIPCYNEEDTLPRVFRDLPRRVEGIDEIKTLIIDDGSTDGTVQTARRLGVDYIVQNNRNMGLAHSFAVGLDACLSLGADIIVNTDGDNQYQGKDIEKILLPLIENRADIAVGCRSLKTHPEFSPAKKLLQRIGSRIVALLSNQKISDVTSGFRAFTREAAVKLSVFSNFSYTLETLIQSKKLNLTVCSVPIRTNPRTRESRLFKSTLNFIYNQVLAIFRVFIFYSPMRFFGSLSLFFLVVSMALSIRIIRFLALADNDLSKFKIGTGILVLFTSLLSVMFLIAGFLGTVLSGIRFIIIDIRIRIRHLELKMKSNPVHRNITRKTSRYEFRQNEP